MALTHRPSEGRWRMAVLLALAAALCWVSPSWAASGRQAVFRSPERAVQQLIDAARAGQANRLLRIFGPEGRKLVLSGDEVADRNGRTKFVAAYDQAHEIDRQDADRAVLVIGEKRWPFPIPLVRRGTAWRFDTAAGAKEVIDRRIGRNELGAIQVCRAYVDAQREYAAREAAGEGPLEYAQHFLSRNGARDGLYWPTAAGEQESPMGPLVVAARAEGYDVGKSEGRRPEPYHGYFYRILKRQGPHAADGARDYLLDGHMIAGFALVAFPAAYGDSGVMSFIVNQDGVVYQGNLGPRTEEIARQMASFEPDEKWTRVAAAPAAP